MTYPGLPDNPHARAARLTGGRGYGGMVAPDLGSPQAAWRFTDALRVLRAGFCFSGVARIPDGLVRISVGLEDAAGLLPDIERALEAA